jgi:hypothetical protein
MHIHPKAAAWFKAALSGAVLAAAVAACGGGDDDPAPPPPVVTPPVATSAYATTALVADVAPAPHVDTNLVNAWGIAFNPTGFVWVATTRARRPRPCTTATACRRPWSSRFPPGAGPSPDRHRVQRQLPTSR